MCRVSLLSRLTQRRVTAVTAVRATQARVYARRASFHANAAGSITDNLNGSGGGAAVLARGVHAFVHRTRTVS